MFNTSLFCSLKIYVSYKSFIVVFTVQQNGIFYHLLVDPNCHSSAGQLLPPEPPPDIATPPPPFVNPPTIPLRTNCAMPDSAPSHVSVTGELLL